MQLKRDDRGVTLVELIVVIAILGVIVAPLTAAFIMFIRNTNQAQIRLEVSHDAQVAGSYFAQDVTSIGRHDWSTAGYPLLSSIETNVAATGGTSPCGTASTPAATVRFSWDDPSAAQTPPVVRVSYVLEPLGGGVNELHRIKCVGSATPVSDIVLAHNVTSATVACATPSTCTGATVPQTVSLTLTIQVTGSSDPPLTVILSGQRRQT